MVAAALAAAEAGLTAVVAALEVLAALTAVVAALAAAAALTAVVADLAGSAVASEAPSVANSVADAAGNYNSRV